MSPRIVDMAHAARGGSERQARIGDLHAQLLEGLPRPVRELIAGLTAAFTCAHVLGVCGHRYQAIESQIPARWKLRFPVSPEGAIFEAMDNPRQGGRVLTRGIWTGAIEEWQTARSQMEEWVRLELACAEALDRLIDNLPRLDAVIRAAKGDLAKAVPSVSQWLTGQRLAWAPVRQCLDPTLGRTPWRFDYERALPGIRAMEETVVFLVNAEYGPTPKKPNRRKRPPAQADRPLSLIETRTIETVGRHLGNIAAAAREMRRDPKTVRENYAGEWQS